MKKSLVFAVVLALVMLVTLATPALAGKPDPFIEYDSVTYNGLDGSSGTVMVSGISWKKLNPRGLGLQLNSASDSDRISRVVNFPKGKPAKYPQDIPASCYENTDKFDVGEQVYVRYYLITRQSTAIWGNGGQPIATITWGTAYPS